MAEHITRDIVRDIRDLTGRLHLQPELDARDRHSIFIMNDLLSNLSFEREAQTAALNELMANCDDLNNMEPKSGDSLGV